MKSTNKEGSIRPTIGGYGRQKTGALDSNTPSKGGRTVIEYESDGKLSYFQEGRHRGIVAKELGLETMPVWIARRRS